MGSEKFSPKGKQTLEHWLRTAQMAFRCSGLDQESWGSALLLCLDNSARSAAYAQLNQLDNSVDVSFETVVEILTQFYGAKETQGTQLEKLEGLTMQQPL